MWQERCDVRLALKVFMGSWNLTKSMWTSNEGRRKIDKVGNSVNEKFE